MADMEDMRCDTDRPMLTYGDADNESKPAQSLKPKEKNNDDLLSVIEEDNKQNSELDDTQVINVPIAPAEKMAELKTQAFRFNPIQHLEAI